MPLGFSFQPGADAQGPIDQPVGGRSVGQAGSSPQEAVKILSLRVPKTLPTNAPVNRSLLTAPGSAAPGASGLTSLVQALLEAFKPSMPTNAPMQPSQAGSQAPGQALPTFPSQGQAAQPTGPIFEGNIDTLPLQNAQPPEGLDLNTTVYDFTGWKAGRDDPFAYDNAVDDPFVTAPWFPKAPAYRPPTPKFTVDNGMGGLNWMTGDRA